LESTMRRTWGKENLPLWGGGKTESQNALGFGGGKGRGSQRRKGKRGNLKRTQKKNPRDEKREISRFHIYT